MIAPFLVVRRRPVPGAHGAAGWSGSRTPTHTDQYPYSTPAANNVNYIRNSVKVAVDAYDGTTTFYLADPKDPIARHLRAHLPGALPAR